MICCNFIGGPGTSYKGSFFDLTLGDPVDPGLQLEESGLVRPDQPHHLHSGLRRGFQSLKQGHLVSAGNAFNLTLQAMS